MTKINHKLAEEIIRLRESGKTFKAIGEELGINPNTVSSKYYHLKGLPGAPINKIPQSKYFRYNEPPVLEGDALILPDVEAPYQNADFLNKVIDLARSWRITQMIADGDLLHMDSLSGWQPNWSTGRGSGLSDSDEKKLMDIAMTLPSNKQAAIMELIGEMEGVEGKDYGREMIESRKVVQAIDKNFENCVWILGNHEDRLLRAINSPIGPSELLSIMNLPAGKWKIAPYYYGILVSGGQEFRITHPRSAADNAAVALATQYHQHILMAHSHKMRFDWDPSGKYAAIHMGHCVDETRLAYASQRDARRNAHKLGAVIIRNGYIWLLSEHSDWETLKKLK